MADCEYWCLKKNEGKCHKQSKNQGGVASNSNHGEILYSKGDCNNNWSQKKIHTCVACGLMSNMTFDHLERIASLT